MSPPSAIWWQSLEGYWRPAGHHPRSDDQDASEKALGEQGVVDLSLRLRELGVVTSSAGRSWTELFFLDEAVALRRGTWSCSMSAQGGKKSLSRASAAAAEVKPPAAAMDAVLHRERISGGGRRVHAMPAPLRELPSGTVVAVCAPAYTAAGRAFRSAGLRLRAAAGDTRCRQPADTTIHVHGSSGYRPVLRPTLAAFAAGATQ